MITKDMIIGEILQNENSDKIIEILTNEGMHCFGCPASQMETLEEACMVHGLDIEDVLKKVNLVAK